jgi:DNA polymerase III alpha subunit
MEGIRSAFQVYAGSPARFTLRMGFRYAKGLQKEAAQAIVHERNKRPFESIADLAHRVPELRRKELVLLASIGALNSIGGKKEEDAPASIGMESKSRNLGGAALQHCILDPVIEPALAAETIANHLPQALKREILIDPKCRPEGLLHPSSAQQHLPSRQRLHRRDALWQVERAVRFAGPLLEEIPESDTASPLAAMTPEERLVADFHGAGLTVGPHPMAYRRADLRRARVLSAKDLEQVPNGTYVRTAGCVIARQRPGTAKGFVFLSLEDETGIGNAIISPDVMDQNRILIQSEKFLLLEGVLQNQEGVISVKVNRLAPMREAYAVETVDVIDADVRSHDFH